MKKKKILIIVSAVMVVLLCTGAFFLCSYASIGSKSKKIEKQEEKLIALYDEKAELCTELVEMVRLRVIHGEQIVSSLRDNTDSYAKANGLLQKYLCNKRFAKEFEVVVGVVSSSEALKEREDFMKLKEELKKKQDTILEAEEYYNKLVEKYNKSIEGFPGSFYAKKKDLAKKNTLDDAAATISDILNDTNKMEKLRDILRKRELEKPTKK